MDATRSDPAVLPARSQRFLDRTNTLGRFSPRLSPGKHFSARAERDCSPPDFAALENPGRVEVIALMPFFAVGIGAGLFTAWIERNFVGAHGASFQLSILQRCLIAARDFWFYLFKLLWPAELTFIYPRWQINGATWWQYFFILALAVLLAFAWTRRKNSRGLLAAILIFLGLLFPALGFINVYPFLYSFVADHFQYLACAAP